MLPINSGGHSAYQNFIVNQLRKYYPDCNSIPRETWNIIEHFWLTDLSKTDSLMKDSYSNFGPKPRLPSCMLRSYLFSIQLKISITSWVAQMKVCPLYAIISGFEFGNTPGVGTFYDFFNRLWLLDDDNINPHFHKPKPKVKKPTKKGDKAKSIEKTTVEELFKDFENNTLSPNQPYSLLLNIYKQQFLDVSIQNGFIDSDNISAAGDGTPIVTSARERKHRICSCSENGINDCECERHYSQPDCDIGWDSSRNCFYHGYDLYMFVDSDSESDLPIFPLFSPASRHDSHGFVHAFFAMRSLLPDLNIKKLLLDSAHDAMPIYEFCKKNDISAFIDLNEKRGINIIYKDDFTIGKDGIPICKTGRKMNHDGVERKKYRIKFRCPLSNRKRGCYCPTPCSDSKYGRTVHLQMNDNPRLFNIPTRDSQQWKTEYNKRTSVERSNKRQKIDFQIESGRHRSSKMWYCRLYCIMMCQHLNAWDIPFASELKSQLMQAA